MACSIWGLELGVDLVLVRLEQGHDFRDEEALVVGEGFCLVRGVERAVQVAGRVVAGQDEVHAHIELAGCPLRWR